jgi:hypothetical protein
MSLNLDKYADDFESLLHNPGKCINYMPIIRNVFLPYLVEVHGDIDTEEHLFVHEISRSDIILAGVRYVDTTGKVRGQRAIDKYLTVIGEFYKKVIDRIYPVNSLANIGELHSLAPVIDSQSEKMLAERKTHSHIDDAEFDIVVTSLKETRSDSYKDNVLSVSLKLILLYGFKIGVLSNLSKLDYSSEMRSLRVPHSDGDRSRLELPYALSKQIDWIISKCPIRSDILFPKENGEPLSTDYFTPILDSFDSSMENKRNVHFTLTGMSKYAAIRMFIRGINPYEIAGITGMGPVDIAYCQKEAARIMNNAVNINSYIRGIRTFDVFNDVV